MRDLIVLSIVIGSLPIILFRPYLGLLVYSWLAYMRPQDMTWGFSRVLPLSQWVAMAMVVGLVVTFGRERLITIKIQTVMLILLGLWISLSAMNALIPELAWEVYSYYWKGIVIALLTTGLVKDRERFRWLFLLIPFCIGFLGAKRGLVGILKGGAQYSDGPGGFMADNNSFALMLNVSLPMLVGVATTDPRRPVRIAATVIAVLTVPAILFTFSRGGFLTLCVVAAMLFWRSKNRLMVAGVMAVALIGLVTFTSDTFTQKYMERTSTIDNYEEDGSAQGRLNAWRTSWNVFLDYPVLGIGPNNLIAVFRRYSPEVDRFRVAHNAYFQLLSESGLPSLLLFVGALGTAIWRMNRLRLVTALPWVVTQARMLQISIIAFMTGSMFLNTAYNEVIYHLVGLTVCLEVVAEAEARKPVPVAGATGAAEALAPGEDVPWWKRPPAPAVPRVSGGVSGMGRV